MVGMTAILVVAAIAVTGAVVARVTWRRPADERHSIQTHQQTLETLRGMADRRPALREKAAEPAPAPDRGSRSRPTPSTPVPGGSGPSAAVRSNPSATGSARAVPSRTAAGRSGV